MKSSNRVAATLLLAVVLSASAYAGTGPDSVADATPFAAGPGTIISSAAAEQFSSGNTSYRRGDYAGAFKLYREAALDQLPK